MDAKMEIMQEMGNQNNAEVVSFDYDTNMVCGKTILEDDAKAIINRMKTLEELSGLSAIKSGFYLLALKEKADIKSLGYANIYELAKDVVGISRGVTSERLQIATRFRNTDNPNVYDLDEKYKGFRYSVLYELRKKSNEEIEELGITADTKYLEVKEALEPKKSSDSEQPKDEQPKDEQPKDEQPKDEQPKDEQPKDDEPNILVYEVEFSELPDYVKQTLRKYYRGLKKEVIGNLVVTNLK